jgi:5'-nucleotidase / UDP-sugar diphosphatase
VNIDPSTSLLTEHRLEVSPNGREKGSREEQEILTHSHDAVRDICNNLAQEVAMNRIILQLSRAMAMTCICVILVFSQGVDVTLLHVNDTHSHLDAFGPKDKHLDGTTGGIAKAASIIGMVRAAEPNVVLLHAGDLFHGDFFYNMYFGVPEFKIMQQLGFDAMAVGNHEWEFGPDVLYGSLSAAFGSTPGFPLLSANTDLAGYPDLNTYIKPAVIITRNGLKIAVFGMTIPGHPTENPAPAVILPDVMTIAYQMVDSLRTKEGAQVVVCLSHLGSLYDQAIAANIPGVDVIVGGHDHYVFEQPISIPNPAGTSTLIVQAGANYEHIGKLSLHVENGIVSVKKYQMLDVNASVPKVPEIQAVVDQLKLGITQQYGNVYHKIEGIAVRDLERSYDPNIPLRDTPLGNLVTDACRKKTHTDIAIAAHGFINEKIYKGPIVGADIFRPLCNGYDPTTGLGFKLVTMDLTGMDIVTGLEASLSYLGLDDDFFLDVSGMHYRYDATRPVGSRVDMKSIRIDGKKLNPSATYTVAVNEGISALLPLMGITPTNVQVLPDLEYNVVRNYIRRLEVVDYQSDGRIRDVSVHSHRDLAKNSEEASDESNELVAPSLPKEFQVSQNYPNPFNPSTTFSIDVPKESYVSLKIYNLLGQEVATLANGPVQAGTYQCRFDGSALSSGTYIYQLRAGNVVQTKKMILMK